MVHTEQDCRRFNCFLSGFGRPTFSRFRRLCDLFGYRPLDALLVRRTRLMRSRPLHRALLFLCWFCHSVNAFGNRLRPKNGRLIKNISPTAQVDSVKKFTKLQTGVCTQAKPLPTNGFPPTADDNGNYPVVAGPTSSRWSNGSGQISRSRATGGKQWSRQ